MNTTDKENRWNEQLSQEFIDYGRYFVPDREDQIEVIADLLPMGESPGKVVFIPKTKKIYTRKGG